MNTNDPVPEIAQVCHEANRAYREVLGETAHLPWDLAPMWQRVGTQDGVRWCLEHSVGMGGEQFDVPAASAIHGHWMTERREAGWQYGPIYSVAEKTHPNMVDWNALDDDQKRKDRLFRAIVKTMGDGR